MRVLDMLWWFFDIDKSSSSISQLSKQMQQQPNQTDQADIVVNGHDQAEELLEEFEDYEEF